MLPVVNNLTIFLFITTALLTVFMLSAAVWHGSYNVKFRTLPVAFLSLMWCLFVSILALLNYFQDATSMPPRIAVPIMMSLSVIMLLFITGRGRRFIDRLSLRWLTWLHIVRIPVEVVLYLLATEKMVPRSMTFEGINFDILSGLTAPLIAWLYFNRKIISRKVLIVWNVAALLLLFNVVINAVLSLPSPLQRLNFDTPNTAVMYFPFAWLPAFIVPAVLFSHLVAFRQLTRPKAASE